VPGQTRPRLGSSIDDLADCSVLARLPVYRPMGNRQRGRDRLPSWHSRPVTELASNAAIENAAIVYVIAYETAQGRLATDARGKGAPADVRSDRRVIEVKAYGRSARGQDLWLEASQVAEAESNPDFWVVLVDNVRQGDPAKFGLRLLGGELLAELVAKKRVQTTYILPFPVGEYDAAPSA
jgi:Domain of unknown function (DUF3883)